MTQKEQAVHPPSRVKLLRKRLGLSQGDIERSSGGLLSREEVSKLDKGEAKGTSWKVRDGLSRALGVDIRVVAAYLDGELDLDGIVEAISGDRRTKAAS
jgi:transcriptional regulator with XRE-family HTH domain